MRLHGIQIDQGARAAMLLLKLGLIRLQHAYLAPTIEEEHNGAHPKDEHKSHDEHLLGAYYDLGACKESEEREMKKERQREKGERERERGSFNSQFNWKCYTICQFLHLPKFSFNFHAEKSRTYAKALINQWKKIRIQLSRHVLHVQLIPPLSSALKRKLDYSVETINIQLCALSSPSYMCTYKSKSAYAKIFTIFL